MRIDYAELEKALAEMKPRQRLFELIKSEMKKRGHWKPLPRGKTMSSNDKRRGNIKPRSTNR